MNLFPNARSLEFVCMDILGPLLTSSHGNRFILAITDQFSKLKIAISIRNMTTATVSQVFCDHWVFAYSPPAFLLTDNGTQFASRFFLAVCGILDIRKLFTTTYQPDRMGKLNGSTAPYFRGYETS